MDVLFTIYMIVCILRTYIYIFLKKNYIKTVKREYFYVQRTAVREYH